MSYAVAAVAVEVDGPTNESAQDAINSKDHQVVDAALSLVRGMGPGHIAWIRGYTIIVLLPDESGPSDDGTEHHYRRRVRQIKRLLEQRLDDIRVWTGLGQPASQVDLLYSYEQAIEALWIARVKGREGAVQESQQLGFYRVFAGASREGLLGFVHQQIGPLLDYDEQNGTELVATVGAFLAEESSFTRAARKLYVHPNTVKYRIDRAEELLGALREKADKRLAIELAVGLSELLGGTQDKSIGRLESLGDETSDPEPHP